MVRYFKNKFWCKTGNKKIGEDTIVFSFTTARDCPSRKLGLCQVPKHCYSDKAERMYKSTLPYRETQATQWDKLSVSEIHKELMAIIDKYPEIKFIRFSENGDFRNFYDVMKLKILCGFLSVSHPDVKVYGFTARKDLKEFFKAKPSNLTINGSGFTVDNSFTVINKEEATEHKLVCPGDCRTCSLCKTAGNRDIKVVLH